MAKQVINTGKIYRSASQCKGKKENRGPCKPVSVTLLQFLIERDTHTCTHLLLMPGDTVIRDIWASG